MNALINLESAIDHARVGPDWPDPARRDNAAPPWAQGGTTTLGGSSRAQSGVERSHPTGESIGSQKHQQNQVLIEGLKRSTAFSRFKGFFATLIATGALLGGSNAAAQANKWGMFTDNDPPPIVSNGVLGGRCLDRWNGVGAGNDVSAGPCYSTSANQHFVVQTVMMGQVNKGLLIRTYNWAAKTPTDLCLVARNGRQEGSTVMTLPCNPHDPRMLWTPHNGIGPITEDDGRQRGDYAAVLRFDQLCLDLEGAAAKSPPQRVIMWGCHSRANQNWGFKLIGDWNL